MITEVELQELAEAAAEFRRAEEGDSNDAEYEAGSALAELAEELVTRSRVAGS